MKNTYDPASRYADELLSYFSRNTAITITHKFMGSQLEVKSARTGNVIATVLIHETGIVVDELFTCPTLESAAVIIAGKKRFPKPKNTKKAWSPIRLNAKSLALMESDSGIRFA